MVFWHIAGIGKMIQRQINKENLWKKLLNLMTIIWFNSKLFTCRNIITYNNF